MRNDLILSIVYLTARHSTVDRLRKSKMLSLPVSLAVSATARVIFANNINVTLLFASAISE